MKKKAYYYYALTSSDHQKYFKALNKKQVKQYLADNHVPFDGVQDPSSKPAEGVRYIDVTNYVSKKEVTGMNWQ